jgi:hypothetical protein
VEVARHVASPDINTEDISAAADFRTSGFRGSQPYRRHRHFTGGMAPNAAAVDKRIMSSSPPACTTCPEYGERPYDSSQERRTQMLEQMSQQLG